MKQRINRIFVAIMVLTLAVGSYSKAQATALLPVTSGKPVYAYYYLWWSTQHWKDKLGANYPYSSSPLPLPANTDVDGCAPVSNYAGNQLIDAPTALISQDTAGVIENDIRLAKSAGVTGFWLNWIGNGSTTQTLTSVTYTPRLTEAFAASNRVGGFANWVSYEASSLPSADAVINDLNFAYAQFGSNAAWQKIDGQPAVVLTGSRKYSDADVTRISNALRDKFYFVGDESRATLTDARLALYDGITYYWSSQDPYGNPASFDQIKQMGDKVHAAGKRWFAPFTPGFNTNLLTGGTTCVPRKNGDTMRTVWNGNSASNPDGRILISWNEIGENSHIKPLQKWGNTYLNVLTQLITNESKLSRNKVADFDGDGDTDIAVFRASNSTWYISGQGSYIYGTVGDIPVSADYNGDGKTDMAVFRLSNSTWYIRGQGSLAYGSSGDVPVVADYNGDGNADMAVFRATNGIWSILGQGSFTYGTLGDIPVPADYNGDGKADIAVFRPTNGTWYVYGQGSFAYGTLGDIPIPADYNGDGKTDMAVFRPSNSTWYVCGQFSVQYGAAGDIPVPGDYDGDGKFDVAVFKNSTGTWQVKSQFSVTYGATGDFPLPVRDTNGNGDPY